MSLVSIITPAYNCEAYIGKCIESIQAQTYPHWELLITDDCSTDNTVEIVKKYAAQDPRIKLFELDRNGGAGVARNNSIERAQGRYLAFCDSDDMWAPNKLEKQLAFMQSHGYKFTYTYSMLMNEQGVSICVNKRPKRVSFNSTKIINQIATTSVIYDTEGIGKFYMKSIRRRQDWALWLDILKVVKYAYCYPEPLSYYRYTPNSVSANKMKLFKYHIDVYHQALGYSMLKSYLIFYCISLPCLTAKVIFEKIKRFLGR